MAREGSPGDAEDSSRFTLSQVHGFADCPSSPSLMQPEQGHGIESKALLARL